MLRRLKIKFVAVVMTLAAAMLCAVLGMLYHFTRVNLEQESLSMMRAVGTLPGIPGRPGQRPGRVGLPYFTLRLGARGELLAVEGDSYDLSDGDFLREVMDRALDSGEEVGVLGEYDLRFCRMAAPMGQNLVFADISSERATLRGLAKNCVLAGLGCAVFLFGASILLARWMARPVEDAWRRQRQFVADASHELKTPLTVITTNAELLESGECDGESRRRFSGSILTMAREMRGLVEGLLELARADDGQAKAVFTRLELASVAEQALLPFEAVFFERGLAVSNALEEGLFVSGDAAQLRRVVEILLDNAQKYASPGGQVRLELRREGRRRCCLSVANSGESLPEEELQNIFKRFYRTDKARSRGGFGLGLSIAQGIVSGHGGRIWAESGEGMNTFFVELPLAR